MNREIRRLLIHCVGIKKRCRKSDRHVLETKKEFPVELSEEVINEAKEEAIKVINESMKVTNKASIKLGITEIKDDGSESFIIFDERDYEEQLEVA